MGPPDGPVTPLGPLRPDGPLIPVGPMGPSDGPDGPVTPVGPVCISNTLHFNESNFNLLILLLKLSSHPQDI